MSKYKECGHCGSVSGYYDKENGYGRCWKCGRRVRPDLGPTTTDSNSASTFCSDKSIPLSEDDLKDMFESIPKQKSLLLHPSPISDGFEMLIVDTDIIKSAILMVQHKIEPFKWVPKKLGNTGDGI